jgi:hypothetical protein
LTTEQGKRRAVIVGINKYEHHDITELKGAEQDAKEFFEIMSDPINGRFEVKKDDTFLVGKQATVRNIRRAISEVFVESQNELALFYFSGHGLTSKKMGEGFIAPWDLDPYYPFTGLRVSELKEIVYESIKPENARSQKALAILDCCYSGQMTQEGKMLRDDEAGIVFEDSLKNFEASRGVFVLASSRANETSREISEVHKDTGQPEGHSHGLLTYHLLDALSGKAGHTEGNISLFDISNYVNTEVKKISAQEPTINFSGSFDLAKLQFVVSDPSYMEAQISTRLKTIKGCHQGGTLNGFLIAACELKLVLERWPGCKEAQNWKQKIDQALNDFKDYDKMGTWFSLKYQYIDELLKPGTAYDTLNQLVEAFPLDYAKASKFRDDQRGLLGRLHDASLGILDLPSFIAKCRKLNNIQPGSPVQQSVPTQQISGFGMTPPRSANSKDSFSKE